MASIALHERSRIIGRDEDRRRVAELLAECRFVTLTGPGGMGKTTLARSVLASTHDAERWFVDLWSIDQEADVPRAVAAAMELVATEAEDAETAVIAFLRARTALLVLDNVEQLPGVGRRIRRWLDAAPDLRILATSRIPLGIAGEQEVPVLGLALPRGASPGEVEASPAGRLFLDTARRLGALEVVDVAVARDLAALLKRLDGMPLAIELAAGRSRVLTPSGLTARLDDPSVIAATNQHDGDARQGSLDRVLSMTLDLLPDPERRFLAALSVCPGAFGVDLAAALAPDLPVVPAVDLLLAAGLARRESDVAGDARFSLLATIRAHVGRELGPAERAIATERHAVATAAMAEVVELQWTVDEGSALSWFVAEDGNISAAVAWASEHDAALGLRLLKAFFRRATAGVQLDRSVLWYRTMLAAAPADDPLRRRVLGALVRLQTRYAGPLEALTLEQQLLEDIDAQPRPVQRAVYMSLAFAYYALGDVPAHVRYDELASVVADDPDDAVALRLGAAAARAWAVDRDAPRSASLYRQAAEANARAGLLTNRAIALFKAALADLRARRLAPAAAAAREAIDLCPPGNLRAFSRSIHALALCELGDNRAARESLVAAWHEVEQETRVDRIEVLEAAVAILAAEGRHAAATTALAVADRDRPATGWRRDAHIEFLLDRWRQRAARELGPVRMGLAVEAAAATTIAEAVIGALIPPAQVSVDGSGTGMVERLTPREVEVLALVAQGRSDGEIATELLISPKTASVHVANIKGKLGLDSRLQVALRAREIGLTGGSSPTVN